MPSRSENWFDEADTRSVAGWMRYALFAQRPAMYSFCGPYGSSPNSARPVNFAGASRIQVTVGLEDKRGCLSIRDNGVGLQSSPDKTDGLGLRIMKHRCGLIDAEIEIDSTYTEGTEIKCYFPVESS